MDISPVSYYSDEKFQSPIPLNQDGTLNLQGLNPAQAGIETLIEIYIKNNTEWYLDFEVSQITDPDLRIIYPPLNPFGTGIVKFIYSPPKERIAPLDEKDWLLRIISSPNIIGR